jgi:hypothetical protein
MSYAGSMHVVHQNSCFVTVDCGRNPLQSYRHAVHFRTPAFIRGHHSSAHLSRREHKLIKRFAWRSQIPWPAKSFKDTVRHLKIGPISISIASQIEDVFSNANRTESYLGQPSRQRPLVGKSFDRRATLNRIQRTQTQEKAVAIAIKRLPDMDDALHCLPHFSTGSNNAMPSSHLSLHPLTTSGSQRLFATHIGCNIGVSNRTIRAIGDRQMDALSLHSPDAR